MTFFNCNPVPKCSSSETIQSAPERKLNYEQKGRPLSLSLSNLYSSIYEVKALVSHMPILVQNVPPPWTCAIFVRESRAHSSQHVAMAANDNGFGKHRAEVANCSRVAVASGWL